jgi:phage terminase large subunit-like protein
MLFQKAFISALYGFKEPDGADRFTRALFLVARKNGKSEFMSALANAEFFLGLPGADIVASSNDEAQASIVYDAIDLMRQLMDPRDLDTKRNQRFILNKLTNTKIYKLSQTTRNKEGRNIDFAIVDEVHEMRDNDIIKAIEQSQSTKVQPKLVIITTEGFIREGVLDNELAIARAIIRGDDDTESGRRYLPWIYEQDSETEVWQNPETWIKSNPALGVIKQRKFLEGQVDTAKKSKADRPFVLTKDFNIPVNTAESWLMDTDYNYESGFDIEELRGCFAIGAVDLSETTDLCSAKMMIFLPGDDRKYIRSMYFIPESKLESDSGTGAQYSEWTRAGLIRVQPGNDLDLSEVADWFAEQYKEYGLRIYKIGYDQRFAKDFLRRADDYGFECEMIYQNGKTMGNATRLVEAELKSRRVMYDNNAVDKWCFGNASVNVDRFGNVILIKLKNQAARRIDGAVCLAILYETYRRYRSELWQMVGE